MLRNFTQRLRLGLILWNGGLRKRKWIWVWNFMCQDLRSLQTEIKELTKLNLAVLHVSCDKDGTEPTEDWAYTFFYGKANENIN
jgi:hypothetical protein